MNYIPGFSNYLEASVPEYGPEPIMDLPPVVPQRAAVAPVTQEVAPAEVAAPYDLSGLSGLNNLYGMNFASDFGGGAMGGIYPDDPNTEYIGAPVSNRGNATGGPGNTFIMTADQPVRLVDLRTNQVVFEGTGYDAARKATELGQNMSDTLGRKASYDIQTADPTGVYKTVANEKTNKSTLGTIADIAGTALPMAAMFIPGLQGLGAIAAGAGLGGAGAALKGDNILKGALMGGLTSAGGALLSKPLGAAANLTSGTARALGTGIGATAGGLATGQNLQNSLLGGVLSGGLSYLTPDIQRGLGIGQGAAPLPTSAASSGPTPITTVTASNITSPSVSIGGAKAPAPAKPAELEAPATIVSGSGSPFAAAFPIPSNVLSMAQPTPAADKTAEEDIIKVTGQLPGAAAPSVDLGAGLSPRVIDKIAQPRETLSPEEILVEASKSFSPVSVTLPTASDFLPTGGLPKAAPTETVSPEEILVEARKPITPSIPVTPLSPEVLRAIEGPAEEPPIKVTGRQTNTPPLIAGIETPMPETPQEAEAKKKKLGLEEYLRLAGLASGLLGNIGGGGSQGQTGTYGGGGTGRLNPIFSAKLPSAGGLGAVGVNRTLRPMGDVDWLTYGERPELSFYDYAARPNPAPVTTPVPGNPAGPIMDERDQMRFAKGGRTEFAVNGPGTGRSDDIPAVLSDGEYVIDAETVALLGDGSSKAGAKKLDDLRVKVRKHKGQKLAKGRFSANAKKPEAYLSGGRI